GDIHFRVYWGAGPRLGQPILADIFRPSSYLIHPKLSVDFATGKVSVSFASGPLVSLFGWGDAPASPVVISASDADRVRGNVRSLLADVHVVASFGQPDCAYTNLELGSATRTLGEWSGSSDGTLDFVSGGSERKSEIPERITITSFGAKMALSG